MNTKRLTETYYNQTAESCKKNLETLSIKYKGTTVQLTFNQK